jgi:hypothetical protein
MFNFSFSQKLPRIFATPCVLGSSIFSLFWSFPVSRRTQNKPTHACGYRVIIPRLARDSTVTTVSRQTFEIFRCASNDFQSQLLHFRKEMKSVLKCLLRENSKVFGVCAARPLRRDDYWSSITCFIFANWGEMHTSAWTWREMHNITRLILANHRRDYSLDIRELRRD